MVQQLGVNAGIDLAAQDGFGTLHGQTGHLLAQGFAGLHRFLLGFGAGGGNDLGAFLAGLGLGFLDQLLRQALGIGQALGSVVAGGRQLLLDALVGSGEFGLGLVGGRQAVGDLLRAFVQGRGDGRPDKTHREPDQDREDDHLDDQGGIDAHGVNLVMG